MPINPTINTMPIIPNRRDSTGRLLNFVRNRRVISSWLMLVVALVLVLVVLANVVVHRIDNVHVLVVEPEVGGVVMASLPASESKWVTPGAIIALRTVNPVGLIVGSIVEVEEAKDLIEHSEAIPPLLPTVTGPTAPESLVVAIRIGNHNENRLSRFAAGSSASASATVDTSTVLGVPFLAAWRWFQ